MICSIAPTSTIMEVLEPLNRCGTVFVVDQMNIVLGSITDGDVRRALIRGIGLDTPLSHIMNTNCIMVYEGQEDREEVERQARERGARKIPIVDKHNHLVDIWDLEEEHTYSLTDEPVVIMAGGLGSRLMPLTQNCPKPLLELDGKPIMQHSLDRLVALGFSKFYIMVNYLADQFNAFIEQWASEGIEIELILESHRLGTAGPLSLVKEKIDQPFLVINADLLTGMNFRRFLGKHKKWGGKATVATRPYEIKIPFGVIEAELNSKNLIRAVFEKPTYRVLVNAGIYAFSPEVLQLVPDNEFLDMPDFLGMIREDGHSLHTFPIYEYWEDVGRMEIFTQLDRSGVSLAGYSNYGKT